MAKHMTTRWMVAGLACALALGLSACRESEQNRPLTFQPGVYGGVVDEPLSEEAMSNLRGRHDIQNF